VVKSQHSLVCLVKRLRWRWQHRQMVSDYSFAKSKNKSSASKDAELFLLRRQDRFEYPSRSLLKWFSKRTRSGSNTGVMYCGSRGVRTLIRFSGAPTSFGQSASFFSTFQLGLRRVRAFLLSAAIADPLSCHYFYPHELASISARGGIRSSHS